MGLALVVGGCGEDEPERSPLAESLAGLCDEARADTEALGLPSEKGFSVIKPGAERGLQLAAEIKKLEGTTPAEKEQIASLAEYFRFYHNEIKAGARSTSSVSPTRTASRSSGRNRRSRAPRRSQRAWARPSAPCGRSPIASSRRKACQDLRGPGSVRLFDTPAQWFLGSVVKGGVTGNRRFPASGSARSAENNQT